jgi:RNase P subunit RPR2
MPDLTEELAALYDRAERLFELARVQTAESTTEAGLREANQNGAEAALLAALVLRSKSLERSESGANGVVSDRCLYCARDDRPPYSERVIDDSRGNQMLAQVCSHCLELLQQGRTPDVETVVHDGLRLPWWAEPGNAYFEAYEGSSWQYWLPLLVGMDAGTWFAKMRSEAGAPPTQQT